MIVETQKRHARLRLFSRSWEAREARSDRRRSRSRAEHSIPWLCTPRISLVPILASGAHAGAHVGRAADHLHGLLARFDLADGQLVRIRMLFHGKHLADHNAAQLRSEGLVGLDLDPDIVSFSASSRPDSGGCAAQPALGNVHANCSRKRRSPS